MKICIIGAGGSGLAAGKHLKEAGIDFVIFDSQSDTGGLWNYNPKTERETGEFVHSSLYDSLITNGPKPTNEFSDFPFGDLAEGKSFVHHTVMNEYYKRYIDHFGIRRFICLNHLVESIRPTENKLKPQWEVIVRNIPADFTVTLIFDAIIIGAGHDSHPYYPTVPGIESFSGIVMHAHDYRRPDVFKDKVAYIVGGNISGIDIAVEICKLAKKVFVGNRLSPWRKEFKYRVVEPLIEVREPEKIEDGKIYLADGKILQVDIIVFATGYKYVMPFLTKDCQLTIEDRKVYPLYKHFVHPKWQNMYFIGITKTVGHNEKVSLPSEEEMINDTDEEYRQMIEVKKYPHSWFHDKGFEQFKLHREYAEMGNFVPDPPVKEKIFWHFYPSAQFYPDRYRLSNYEIIDDEHFKILSEVPERGFQVGQIL